MDNERIASVLERIGDLLQAQAGDTYRIRAYRNAADFVRSHPEPVVDVLKEGGPKGLIRLPSIGVSIARIIEELARTGRCRLLARLEGEVTATELFDSLPGVGPELAERIHEELHVETLNELELAAHDGRLETVPGIGHQRAEMIRAALSLRLSDDARARGLASHAGRSGHARPSVDLLLAIDADYRRKAAAGELPRIAPRRFNPGGEAWLPILHTARDGWDMTALFSNTARAHKLGRTNDWVVVFFENGPDEGQCTIVTETHGPNAGRRVVRGRESESYMLAKNA